MGTKTKLTATTTDNTITHDAYYNNHVHAREKHAHKIPLPNNVEALLHHLLDKGISIIFNFYFKTEI